jgi:hypothetical protein
MLFNAPTIPEAILCQQPARWLGQFGNVGALIAFRVGQTDAEIFENLSALFLNRWTLIK